jgi:hypothetical protein
MAEIYFDVDTALSEVPVNIFPLTDDTDFKTRETSVAYNASGMDLVWNFVTTAGAFTQTAVTPTTSGTYDWTHQGDGMYTIEIPASGGASINNDTEGFGWFIGIATGVLPWKSPVYCFRAAGINDKLIDDAYSTTRGLSGTALPAAAADAAGGLPISDAGGLDIDAKLAHTEEITAARMGALTDWIDGGRLDLLLDALLARLTATRAGYIDNLSSAPPTAATIADAVWDETLSGHLTSGSTGAALNAAGDPWETTLPGSYGAGTAGKIIGDNINATISSRSTLTASDVWGYTTRTLSSFGTLVSDIWSHATRTLSAFAFTVAATIADKTGFSIAGTKQTLDALNDFDHTSDTVARVTLVDTCTINSDMRGTNGAYTGTPPTVVQIRQEIDSNSTQIAAIKLKTDNLPSGIKRGIALSNFTFMMKDSSDHVSGMTGLTVSGQIKKDAGAFAAVTGVISEIAYGVYSINTISSLEMTANVITLRFSAVGADDTIIEIVTNS